ncbi:metal-dependent hydrolase family protein [Idiomarina xiamenensis]|uniref:Xaa-Pro dipeptidase family protein n=1 Tax=Idiomarina xiamenensis 10-D-4 TaxID=740709 RepID=K2KLJ5_9GAMM|nr:amidohydrolase family protein [Idiomarina xiamenensis]EKE83399.1 Xaa-Pro dipeptidase family protein [Idiomarina xiamenensis 10-D-4]
MSKPRVFSALAIACAMITTTPSALADTYIHAGRLLDGSGDSPREQVTIIVKDNQISAIEDGFIKPEGTEHTLIDRSKATVMPGLMDMHTHLTSQLAPGSYMDKYTQNEADLAFTSTVYAKKTLMAGFTTVRNLGDSFNVTASLRDAIAAGKVIGPRIFTATKSIATTGGHADPSNGYRDDLSPAVGPDQGVVNGPYEARQAVRKRYQDGADLIKITATGGVLSVAKSGQNPQFMMDELKAIVDTANDYGMKVAVHAHGKTGMLRAVEAGVASVEHGTYMNKEVMDAMKKHGTYFVPTITAGKSVAERAKIDGYFPAIVRPKAAAIGPKIQSTFAEAYKAGVKIAFGTDSGVYDHGENYREFFYMVEAGMPAAEAIVAATRSAADLLGQDKLGQIKPGFYADIIAVDGNPLDDIQVMKSVNFVMKDGNIYKQEL